MKDEQNPYAPPRPIEDERPARAPSWGAAPSSEGAWREGDLCVVPRLGGEMPDRCVVCNRDTDFKLRRTLWWHPPGYYLLICAGWLVYIIAALIVRKSATVEVGLCEEHRRRRENGVTLMWVGGVTGLLVMIVGVAVKLAIFMLLGLIGMLVCLIAGAVSARVVGVDHMDEMHVWLKVSADFARSLPSSPWEPPPVGRPKKKKKKKAPKSPAVAAEPVAGEPAGVESGGVESEGAESGGVESGGVESEGVESVAADSAEGESADPEPAAPSDRDPR